MTLTEPPVYTPVTGCSDTVDLSSTPPVALLHFINSGEALDIITIIANEGYGCYVLPLWPNTEKFDGPYDLDAFGPTLHINHSHPGDVVMGIIYSPVLVFPPKIKLTGGVVNQYIELTGGVVNQYIKLTGGVVGA